MSDSTRHSSYDDWLDAVAEGDGFYLDCPAGHAWLPPRRVCPDCGSQDLGPAPLPDFGDITTHTIVFVATPQFEEEVPYVTAIAEFGPVSITGLVRGADPEAVSAGDVVDVGVGEQQQTGDPVVVFRPR